MRHAEYVFAASFLTLFAFTACNSYFFQNIAKFSRSFSVSIQIVCFDQKKFHIIAQYLKLSLLFENNYFYWITAWIQTRIYSICVIHVLTRKILTLKNFLHDAIISPRNWYFLKIFDISDTSLAIEAINLG